MLSSVIDKRILCHRANILQKLRRASAEAPAFDTNELKRRYVKYLRSIQEERVAQFDLGGSVEALQEYYQYAKHIEKTVSIFNWRSDFAGSVIPEFLHICLFIILRHRGITPYFSTRHSVVEVSLSGDLHGGWDIRRKDQDICLGLRQEFLPNDNGASEAFVVPFIVSEVKTNLDINKLNGLEFSAERLKKSFPSAKYIVATETVDFSPQDNYAGTAIDEIYVLRRQVRSQARKVKKPLDHRVFIVLLRDIVELCEKRNQASRHVYDRMLTGRLIGVNDA